MLLHNYEELDASLKISLMDVANNTTLYELFRNEIASVEREMCNLTPSLNLPLEYAIVQQRLICLKDFLVFLEQIREDTAPQSDTE